MNVGAQSETDPGDYLSWSEGNTAAENWGGEWRLPTNEEWQLLIDKCTWEWDDSKEGMIVTSTNGNSIFLPAAGISGNTVPGLGDYWSSSLDDGDYSYLQFEEGKVPCMMKGHSDLLMSVRFFNDNSHAETFNPEEEG